jgi:putative hydroxymethylpyrimidine transporter CytX
MKYVWVVLLAALCTWWAYGGQRLWRIAERVCGGLLLALTIAMTVIVARQYDLSALWAAQPAGGRQLLAGTDLVVAMSVSWLPLVADYSRFARKAHSGQVGTFWGYFIGGVWMYAVGLLVAVATLPQAGAEAVSPDQLVMRVMGSQGAAWALAAIVLVLLSTVTTTFLDIYSTVISTQNLLPRFPEKGGTIIAGALGVVVALALDITLYEPFLKAIGAVFLPAFSIVIADYFLLYRRRVQTSQLTLLRGAYWFSGGYNLAAILAWIIGFVVYDWAQGFASSGYFAGLFGGHFGGQPLPTGASLPCIAASVVAYMILRAILRTGSRAKAS